MRAIERILEHPAVYAAWQAPFAPQKFAPIERRIRHQRIRRVLDVGCGPGTNAPRFAGAEYIGVDINERYLAAARAKHKGRFIQADLQRVDLSALGTFDAILINSFLHHLADDAVGRILEHLRPLLDADGRVHVLELVLPERLSLATMMARLDRGRYPRRLAAWRELLAAHFEPVVVEPYTFAAGLWAMVYFQGEAKRCVSR